MAASTSINITPADSGSNRKEKVVDVTYDASYPTGGYAITPASLGLEQILGVLPGGNLGGVVPSYNLSTGKLQLFGGAASGAVLAEVTAATNLSAVVQRLIFFGW